jgi:hypothetical protein
MQGFVKENMHIVNFAIYFYMNPNDDLKPTPSIIEVTHLKHKKDS